MSFWISCLNIPNFTFKGDQQLFNPASRLNLTKSVLTMKDSKMAKGKDLLQEHQATFSTGLNQALKILPKTTIKNN